MNTADINIDALLKRLHLANARRTWRDMIARAEKDAWSCRDFLAVLVAEEVAHRQQTRIQRLSSRGGFPFLKTVDDFDFTYQSTVKLSLLGSALSPDFVTDGRSLILHGKSGRGKTHIAVAIGYRAIQNGFDTHDLPTRSGATSHRTCLSSTKSATSPTATPRTSSTTWSPSGIKRSAR